jgi:5-amino-6-(5-phospho-D-ribitylamino)uracil phosphatase
MFSAQAAAPSGVLFLSDVDGTLLHSQGALSTRSREVLHQVLASGAAFSIASARSHFSLRKLFADTPFRLPIIEFNGAFITDFHSGEHLITHALETAVSETLYESIQRHGLQPFVMSFDGKQDCLHYQDLINPGMLWYEARRRKDNDPRLRRNAHLRDALREQVVSLTVMDHNRHRVEGLYLDLREQWGQQLQLFFYENEYDPGNWWLTIHHPRASKHLAMQELVREFVPATRCVVAFGDNDNDLEMLRHAHVAVAVANAKPELKAVAHHVIGHQDEDAVAQFLLQHSLSPECYAGE